MTSRAAKHDKLARDFVMNVVRETESYSDLMVVVESSILATLMVLNRQYDFSRQHSVEMVEVAIQQATARFAGSKQV